MPLTCPQFQQLLRETGRYETPPEARPNRAARGGFLISCRYHAGIYSEIVGSAWQAWRGRYDAAAWAAHSFSIAQRVERFGAAVTYEGFAARAAHAGPVVYASNHMSALETMLLPAVVTAFGPSAIVLKESLLHYPFFGAVCRAIHPIVVSRRHVRADLQAVMEQGTEKLRKGTSVLLFPQATRHAVFQPDRFNSMATKLAQAAGVPLVPLAVKTDFEGLGRWIKDLGPVRPDRPVRIACGPLLSPATPPRALQQQCVRWVAEQLQAWGLPVAEEK